MDLAIEKAKQTGIAWVTCTGNTPLFMQVTCIYDFLYCLGSNHYGIAGFYALRAVKQGLIV